MLSRDEALNILARIAHDERVPCRDRIAAIERAAKMQGFDAPCKTELKTEGSLLHQIRADKKEWSS